ncbi:hypothetical protein HPB47_007784, partial [Ixodes persulcatus]
VCVLHFKAEYLRTTRTCTDASGKIIEFPMGLTRLISDAVPTIMPNCPTYLSDVTERR